MRLTLTPLVMLLVALTACGTAANPPSAIALTDPTAQPTPVEAVTDLNSFADALRAAGATVEYEGSVAPAYLRVSGTILRVGDQRLQVYEYANAAAASADAARFSPDGAWVSSDIGATLINWVATPHLYRTRRLIAVYVGDHLPTLELLETVLGEPFAGGANPYRASITVN